LAIKPSESSKGGGDASKNEMKRPVKIASVWINHGMSFSKPGTAQKGGRK
jgi:hypothetical protein